MEGKVSWDYHLEHVAVVTIFDRISARPRPWCSSCRTAARKGVLSHFLLTSHQQLSRHSFAAAASLQLTVSTVSSIAAGPRQSARHCQAYVAALLRTNTKNSKQIFPEKELRGHTPSFHIHVSVSDLYIYSHVQSDYSAAGNMWTDPRNI